MQKCLLLALLATGAAAHCFHTGMQYNDLSGLNLTSLAVQDFTTSSPEECQAECARVEACQYFTWWNNTKNCFLDTSDTTYTSNQFAGQPLTVDNMGYAEPVAGPKDCGGMPVWGWVLIGLGVVALIAVVAFLLMPKPKPAKKKTRALPKPVPVPTVAEPVPTFTTVPMAQPQMMQLMQPQMMQPQMLQPQMMQLMQPQMMQPQMLQPQMMQAQMQPQMQPMVQVIY